MTMLGRSKRDKAAKEAADDAETPATEAEVDTEAGAEAETDVEAEADVDAETEVDADSVADEAEEADEADEAQAAGKPVKIVKSAKSAKSAGEAPEDGEVSGGSRRGAVLVLAVLSVVTLALAATTVLLWLWKSDLNAKESAARDGLNAATSAAQDFSSYDYRTIESNFKTSANAATGSFRQQYMGMMSRVRDTAQQQQIVVVGTVLKAGVEQVGAKQIVAVVFLNQETSKLNQARSTDQYRLRLTVDKVQDRWLVSKVEAL
jgi:Mce-associated membrane protein